MKEFIDYINHLNDQTDESSFNTKMWYVNNLNKVPLPDPQVMYEDGVYYIVGTTDTNIKVIDCYSTTDFVNFTCHEKIYDPSLYNGWEAENPLIFAAELYKLEGRYYLYYSAESKYDRLRYCSVVVADNPLGPYLPIVNETVDGLNHPVFESLGKDLLDATIFIDDDNKMYMYLVQQSKLQHLTGVEMINPYTAKEETYTKLVLPAYQTPESDKQELYWELFRDCDYKINEAPFMLKHGGKYYMTYSANGCWNKYYNVCYAVSDSPLSGFVKPYEEGKIWTNLLMGYPGEEGPNTLLAKQWDGFASGCAHHSFFYIGDQLMIGYHSQINRTWNGENWVARYFALDYVHFGENGVPFINGPTFSLQPLPEAISGYKNIAKNALIKTENVINSGGINDDYVVSYYNLNSPSNEVLLGKGTSVVEFEFDKEYTIGGIAIYNSAYYEKMIEEVNYIDFGNGNVIYNAKFNKAHYVKDDLKFIYPNSAITLELLKEFKTNKIKICFNLENGGNINEIKILAK